MTLPLITEQKDLDGMPRLWRGKRILVRLDLNVPIAHGKVLDDFRIRKSLPTLKFLVEQGAKIIAISHIGRDAHDTLLPVAARLGEMLGEEVAFGERSSSSRVTLLENLRRDPREEANDEEFARELAAHGDIFVNDAFSASHRKHASIVGVPKFLPSYAGIQFALEIENLSRAFTPEHPFLFILGGAKFETKLPFLQKFTELADGVFVGGALANDILRAGGFKIGKSVAEKNPPEYLSMLASNAKLLQIKDVFVESGENEEKKVEAKKKDAVLQDDVIVDMGPETTAGIISAIRNAKFVLMNGPLGWYERGFSKATSEVLEAIAARSGQGSDFVSILGGGDTVALIDRAGIEDKFTFVSTGGGAMLDYLVDGELPGITALASASSRDFSISSR